MLLSVRFRGVVALAARYPLLAGADLDVAVGEVVVVRGANGAGKTSLLRAMAGLLPLVAGEASVLGLDPTVDARRLRPLVGLLGHRNGLYEDLSAEQNVMFAARAERRPKADVQSALARLGFDRRVAATPAAKLSAGQRRRLALATVLVRQPRLWLLDEPHAGLDAHHRQLLDELLDEVAASGATVVLASHEQLADGLEAKRTVWMSGGAVVERAAAPAVADVVGVAAEVAPAPSAPCPQVPHVA
ncbi:MAG TPA: heme ABC exporter ATP-binding protein CcmA [Acidimicrobiales bacterium]|nr:heme ABC exporter ATP-binding protein CcmA [Acidimicrobiales bacterium]